jgi:hypothetical protein
MTHRIRKPAREARTIVSPGSGRSASDRAADLLLVLFLAAAVLSAAAAAADAQSLRGLSLGDVAGDVVVPTDAVDRGCSQEVEVIYCYWELKTGTITRLTTTELHRDIIYIEVEWGGDAADADLAVPGMRFGETTLNDLRDTVGSTGFVYEGGPQPYRDKGLVHIYTHWEMQAAPVILTAVTAFPEEALQQDKSALASAISASKLQTISMTYTYYAEWMYGTDRSEETRFRLEEPMDW